MAGFAETGKEVEAGSTVRAKPGAAGVLLLFNLAVGVRARHDVLAVGAAVVLVALMLRP